MGTAMRGHATRAGLRRVGLELGPKPDGSSPGLIARAVHFGNDRAGHNGNCSLVCKLSLTAQLNSLLPWLNGVGRSGAWTL
jgi:hypothetical protein